jgi:hypothetical protein
VLKRIAHELRHHAPYTLIGTLVGVGVIVSVTQARVPHEWLHGLFAAAHPTHVLLSAIVTSAMYRLNARGRWWATILIGYFGSIGIGTLSDSLIPYLGELLLGAADPHVHAHAHIGFIELWWLVNPAALLGVAIGYFYPRTRLPHAGHVFLSTAASLFHMAMALEHGVSLWTMLAFVAFLFLAVWLPCCTSDIVFPLLFVGKSGRPPSRHRHGHGERGASAD